MALVDETGKLVAKQRIKDDADGFRQPIAEAVALKGVREQTLALLVVHESNGF